VVLATTLFSPLHGKAPKPKVTTSVAFKSQPPDDVGEDIPRFVSEEVTVRPDPQIYESIIREAAAKHDVDPGLIRAVMRFESAFRPMAKSRAGALGLMQLMPEKAEELGVQDIYDPRENIMAGARYLRELLDRHDGRVDLALASYNAGPTAVDIYHAVPPYPETQRYVKAITAFMKTDRTDTNKP
jgi:soluble lytic murein transglycosylase-like protein